MNISVVFNSKSGSALPQDELSKLFDDARLLVDEWIDITSSDSMKRINKHANAGHTIAAIGGDGTIAHVAQSIFGTTGILAPIPGGTLNHFTKDAGVTQNIAQAIANLADSKTRTIDIATVNDRVFLNNSSMGMYPSSLRARKRYEDKLGKWPAAVIGSLRAFIRYKLYTVTIDGNDYRTPFIFVGNNDYHIDKSGERTTLNEGTLCVYAVTSTTRKRMLFLILAALFGNLSKHEELISFKAQSVTIHTKRQSAINVSTDGEVEKLNTPLTYTIHPGKLTII